VTAITGGLYHFCALLSDATGKCWGDNGDGQLGQGNTSAWGGTPSTIGANLPPMQLGSGAGSTGSVRQLSAGYYHTCAVMWDWSVKCWGANYYGQLGLGDTVDRMDKASDKGNLPAVRLNNFPPPPPSPPGTT
jgi:alpha-tubulin suppressor-like RCC1 family protein